MNTTVHIWQPKELKSELDEIEDIPVRKLNDDFAELDALLAGAMTAKADALKVKDARRRLANGHFPKEERSSVEAMITAWELKKEWLPAASVQMFSAQTCSNCGEVHYHFEGVYQRQIHKVSHTISRWIKSDVVANKGLPEEAKCEEFFAPVCACCSSAFEDA